ncbi:MAG: hypothetical protein H6585_14285 [Flavobacteriales bacterium]|nr:hypothetical protein [Flavobacteriales bacterium]MCB9449498.1 hypothetical protein [Flavobacteriales bacterium]
MFRSKLFGLLALSVFVVNPAHARAQTVYHEEHFDTPVEWIGIKEDVKCKNGKMVITARFQTPSSYEPHDPKASSEYQGFSVNSTYCSGEVTAQWVKNTEKQLIDGGFGMKYFPYRFEIKQDGSYRIFRYDTNTKKDNVVYSSNGAPVPGINTGTAENKIKVVRLGETMRLFVNDNLIKEFPINYQAKYIYSSFPLFASGTNQVLFDDYYVKSVPEEDDPKKQAAAACDEDDRNLNEALYDLGTMKDEDIQALSPAEQLLDHFGMYGLCMKINPLWIRDPKRIIASTISFGSDEMKSLKATFPAFDPAPTQFSITLALNPGDLQRKKDAYDNMLGDGLEDYYKLLGKELTDETWQAVYGNYSKTYNFTTKAGKTGAMITYNVPDLTLNDPTLKSVYLKSRFTVVFMYDHGDSKIVQCTVDFQRSQVVQKPLPDDFNSLAMFSPADEEKCLDFLEKIFGSIREAK